MLSVVSFGGGVNSTALLVGLRERGERPDRILFADTGGERIETYEHVAEVSAWCVTVGFPEIERVDNAAREGFPHESLEDECLNNHTLPSLAYGNKGCSAKWKRQPMDRAVKAWPLAIAAHERGEKIERLIGIDWGEQHRSANLMTADDPWFVYRRPLVDWVWAREECLEAISRAGLRQPPKSACWFCPATRKHEVLDLASREPSLFQRAVAMERNAAPNNGPTTKGLGRAWSWEKLVKADRDQLKLFPEIQEVSCLCFDGEED